MIEYGQFCPVSKTAEVLGEKWTLLIVRELVQGATRFNQMQRAIPRISPTMLNKRLAELQAHRVILRRRIPQQQGVEYQLTASGRELLPLIEQMAQWGMRWARSDMSDDELDVELLMGDIRHRIDPGRLPGGRTMLKFHYTDLDNFADWWVKIRGGSVELCLDDPGYEIDVYFTTDLRTMTEVWMGDLPLRQARAGGSRSSGRQRCCATSGPGFRCIATRPSARNGLGLGRPKQIVPIAAWKTAVCPRFPGGW